MEFKMGAPVLATDGRAGTLDGLIVDPGRGEITHLVVTHGGLLPHDVVLPVGRVSHTDEKGVHVRGTAREIKESPAFEQTQFTEPPEDWLPPPDYAAPASRWLFPASPYAVGAFTPSSAAPEPAPGPVENVPPDEVDISPNTAVICTDGVGGYVNRVITEGDTDQVTHLIVERGTLITRHRVVPVAHVVKTTDDGIYLDLTQEQLDAMPEYEE